MPLFVYPRKLGASARRSSKHGTRILPPRIGGGGSGFRGTKRIPAEGEWRIEPVSQDSGPLDFVYTLAYYGMEFEWDPAKDAECRARRSLDFAFGARIFSGPVLERIDSRRDYGETRVIAVGRVEGVELTLVFVDRFPSTDRTVRRIISVRRSSGHERKAYEAHLARG